MASPKISVDVSALLRELRAAGQELRKKGDSAEKELKTKIHEELEILRKFHRQIDNIPPF